MIFILIYQNSCHDKLKDIKTDCLDMWWNTTVSPREESALCASQDRNIFLDKGSLSPHCNEKTKTVDHMATQCDIMLSHDYMNRHNEALRCLPNLYVEITA